MATKAARRIPHYLTSSALGRPLAAIGAVTALFGPGAAQALDAGALPQGATVVGGAAAIAQSGNTLTVNQSSDRTVIDWRSFDIGSEAQANFNQPGPGSIAVNRVNASANPTVIEGGLHANGQVWILNPNGVLFGKTAHVDAAGIVASTANIDPARFMAGDTRLTLTGADHGMVANDGSISVADNGLAAFVAPSVRNSGSITAKVGKVALAAGTTFTLDLAGDRLVEIGLGAANAVVDQSGKIVDEGGVVTLTARAAGQVVDSVINMSGVVSTASARQVGGQIVLDGDAVTVAGTLDVSGTSGGQIGVTGKTIAVAQGAILLADAGVNGDGGAITAVASLSGDYTGSYSAQGGSASGNGGKIETSGAVVAIDDGIKVDASASNGAAGTWLVDPLDITITAGAGGGLTGSTVTAGAIQTALAGGTGVHITTDQTGTGNGDLTLASSINATSTGNASLTLDGRHLSATGGSTINLSGGALTLNVNKVNTLANVATQPTNWIQDAVNLVGTVSGGSAIKLGAATYAPGATINRSNLSLDGSAGAVINVDPGANQVNAINIAGATAGVTVNGFTINGEVTGSYVDYAFGSGQSRGIVVANQATGFTITNNHIQNVRTGILVDGRNVSGSTIANNLIDNTKTAIFVQYTSGAGISITGNSQGQFGNEWGENFHVNGYYDGANLISYPGGVAPTSVQTALLADKAANNGWSVQDQAYTASNRTRVLVSTTGSDSSQGSPRAPLASIQAGIAAVVAGGEVDINNGTYVSTPSTGYINVNKSLSLIGQSEAGVIIDARHGQQYGLRVTAPNDVTLKNLTVYGVTAGVGYGVKVETITGLNISNVASQGAVKSEFDLNSVTNGVLDQLTANGAPVAGGANTGGNGISISDSQNVTLTNSSTANNAWGGLALYQTNSASGGSLLQETNLTVAANNTFAEPVPLYAEDTSTINDFGALNIAGFGYIVRSPTNPADVVTVFQKTQQAAIDYAAATAPATAWVQGYSGSGTAGNNVFTVGIGSNTQALSIQTAQNAAHAGATINVASGAYTQNVVVSTQTNFNFGVVSLSSFTVQSAAAGSGLSGTLSANAINLAGAVRLTGNLALDTSAANGSISTAAIDAHTAGGDTLSISAGTGAVSLGSLGATTRLGETRIASNTTLTGAAYDADSLSFGGNAVLTVANTTFDTTRSNGAAGNITVSGSVLGVANGAQSLMLTAGPGTGAAVANGDILLQNVGATGLRLNNLTVTGDDFGAQTVDLAGNFAATLVGNQVFSSHTLNAGGTVSSTVGGSASGPINAAGDVTLAVAQNLTGAIAGTNISLTAGALTGASVTASQGANISAGSVSSSTLVATQNVSINAGSVAGSSFTSTHDVNLTATTVGSSSFTAAQNVNVNATMVTSSSLTAPVVTANAATFDANVSASSGATISGGDISGTFTGGSFALAGTGSVNATVTASRVSVTSPQGSVTGTWQNLTTGGGGGVVFNNSPSPVSPPSPATPVSPVSPVFPETPPAPATPSSPTTPGGANQGSGANPSQIVLQNFALPAGTTVTAAGDIALPQGLVIGLLSPGGAGGAPKLIQVQTVQDLGALLAGGYTAIVIDLSGHRKDKKKDAHLSMN